MSAFVVDTGTMNRCVRTLCAKGRYGQVIRNFAGIATDAPNAATEIGRRLFTLNIEAVTQRYPDCEDKPEDLPGTDGCASYPATYRYRGSRIPPTSREMVAGIKALQCLRYQCSEGNVPETPLYREMVTTIGELCENIVETMPEYEAAPWG
jgi:hypothetical protein